MLCWEMSPRRAPDQSVFVLAKFHPVSITFIKGISSKQTYPPRVKAATPKQNVLPIWNSVWKDALREEKKKTERQRTGSSTFSMVNYFIMCTCHKLQYPDIKWSYKMISARILNWVFFSSLNETITVSSTTTMWLDLISVTKNVISNSAHLRLKLAPIRLTRKTLFPGPSGKTLWLPSKSLNNGFSRQLLICLWWTCWFGLRLC